MLEEAPVTSCNGRTAGPAEIVAIRSRPSFSIRVYRRGDLGNHAVSASEAPADSMSSPTVDAGD